jgi:uncharacterized delta-60 repeat protein
MAEDRTVKPFAHFCAFALLIAFAGASLAREGDLDSRFSTDGLQTVAYDLTTAKGDVAHKVIVDPRNGRYIVIGYVDSGAVGMVAFKPDGTADTSFGVSGKIARSAPLLTITGVSVDPINRIVVAGYGRKSGAAFLDFDPVVCRYNMSGFPDTNVSSDGCRMIPVDVVSGGTDTISAVTTDGAGQVYLAGQAQLSATDYDFLVLKLSGADLAPLSTFSSGRRLIEFDLDASSSGGDVDGAEAILLQGTSLYVAGYATDEAGTDFAIAKISALNGDDDLTFCPNSTVCTGSQRTQGKRTIGYNLGGGNDDRARALATAADGTILIAGEVQRTVSGATSNNYLVTRIGSNGAYPGSFGSGVSIYNAILPDLLLTDMAVRGDGRILIAGTTASTPTAENPNRVQWVVQLSSGGLPDGNFAGSLGGGGSSISLIAFDSASGQPLNHEAGRLTLDRGRILLAGARLWAQNLPGGVKDFDYGVARLKGDSIFADGVEF